MSKLKRIYKALRNCFTNNDEAGPNQDENRHRIVRDIETGDGEDPDLEAERSRYSRQKRPPANRLVNFFTSESEEEPKDSPRPRSVRSKKFNEAQARFVTAAMAVSASSSMIYSPVVGSLITGGTLLCGGTAKFWANTFNLCSSTHRTKHTCNGIVQAMIESSLGLLIAATAITQLSLGEDDPVTFGLEIAQTALLAISSLVMAGEILYYEASQGVSDFEETVSRRISA